MAPPPARLPTAQFLSSMVYASSITMVNLPLTRWRYHPGGLGEQGSPCPAEAIFPFSPQNRAHSFSLLTALFLEPRKGPYTCNFPLYTTLTFLNLAAFQRAILHPRFSTLLIHNYASQFLKFPSSTFCSHVSLLSHFTILLPSTSISQFTTTYRPELGFICPPL